MSFEIDISERVRQAAREVKAYTDYLSQHWKGPEAWHLLAAIGSLKFYNLLRIPPPRALVKASRQEVEEEAAFQGAIGQATQEFRLRWDDIERRINDIEGRRAADKAELQGLQKERNRLRTNLQASIELQQTEARLEVLRAKKARLDETTDLSGPLTTVCNLTVSAEDLESWQQWRRSGQRQRRHLGTRKVSERYRLHQSKVQSLSSQLQGRKQWRRR